MFKRKAFTDNSKSKCGLLTDWIEVTMQELKEKVKKEIENKERKQDDDENCTICMCELYDDILTKSDEEIKAYSEK